MRTLRSDISSSSGPQVELDNARIHRSTEQNLVFVVHGHHNEEFRMPAIEIRSEAKLGTHEIVRVTSRSSVAHLRHFLDVVHALRNDMGGDLDVENKVSVLEFNVPNGPAPHEFFPGNRVAGAHSGRGHRRSGVWGRGVIWLVRKGRGNHLVLITSVEVSLRVSGVEGAIGFCLPVVFVVVMV